jgi:uncharacterized protein (DUF4415 family)
VKHGEQTGRQRRIYERRARSDDARGETESDWERLRSRTDEEVEASIDFEEEGSFDWDTARVSTSSPQPKKQVTLWLDPDIIAFFKGQGPGYQTRMNQVLRSYVEAQIEKESQGRTAS